MDNFLSFCLTKNSKLQSKQMDFYLRFWDDTKNLTKTRYYGSKFLGHGTANDMVEHFTTGIKDLPMKALVQISMDGPNVNWKFYNMMKKQMKDDHDVSLINICSCGLHVVHNAFKTGIEATTWDLSSVMAALYYLFKDSPARREDYTAVTGSSVLPLKFVTHRWMENVPGCERAIKVWDNLKLYVQKAEKKEVTKPTNKSYSTVLSAVQDKLIRPKLDFFHFIALHLQNFLANFQSDKPMVPFLHSELIAIVKNLLKLVVKPEVISAAGSQLSSINLEDKDNFLSYSKVEIGFSTEKELKVLQREDKSLSARQIMEFRLQCRGCVIKLVKMLLEKSPLQYNFARHMGFLDPREMVAHQTMCVDRFKKVLEHLVENGRVHVRDCDLIIQQYKDFLTTIPNIGTDQFTGFDPYSTKSEERVDAFLAKHMAQQDKFSDIRTDQTTTHTVTWTGQC